MRWMLFFLSLFLLGFISDKPISSKNFIQKEKESFKLDFLTIGFGSNMFDMQPVFRVIGKKFFYTSEEVWVYPGQTKIQRDTLLTGDFRRSSIDSITNFISSIEDSIIHNVDLSIISGTACHMEIVTDTKQIKFNLHNTSDSTAEKIVSVLNSYIPIKYKRLNIAKW